MNPSHPTSENPDNHFSQVRVSTRRPVIQPATQPQTQDGGSRDAPPTPPAQQSDT